MDIFELQISIKINCTFQAKKEPSPIKKLKKKTINIIKKKLKTFRSTILFCMQIMHNDDIFKKNINNFICKKVKKKLYFPLKRRSVVVEKKC